MLNLEKVIYRLGKKAILDGISVKIGKEENLLIHGESGCGKSTLMHIMAGFLKPTSGSIVFNGQAYDSLSNGRLDRLRGENYGFVFQKINLIGHLTARQNIELAYSKRFDDEIVKDLGITNVMAQKASSLSVGEAQRVALARALVNNPKIIFADEPTSALDKNNADKVIKMLFQQAKKCGASLVVTSHDERIQSYFDNKLSLGHD